MKIDSIHNGYVLDHITAGNGMKIYNQLKLDALTCSVAIIKNVKSNSMGKKDIIKIDQEIALDFEMLGFIDPNITINLIREGECVEKKSLTMPTKVINIMTCKNPRCITRVERELDHVFVLANTEKRTYRCMFCEEEYTTQ